MNKTTLTIIGAALVAILSLGYAGYTMSIPHVATVTQQQYLTNTQNFFSTQTQTVTATNTNTVTSAAAVNNAINLNGREPGFYQTCGYYGCSPAQGYTYTPCTPVGGNGSNQVTCYGYLVQNGNGCTQLSVQTTDPNYWRSGLQFVHYTLQNLPASSPPIGSWVDVIGQLSITSTSLVVANSAACSPNTLTVSSITPTSPPQGG